MLKKRILAGILAITFSTSSMASIQTQMQGWFNEMGAYGNVTGAQAIRDSPERFITKGLFRSHFGHT